MELHDKYALTKIINARGVFTPLGVSRSSKHVADITAQALGQYFDIDELQARAATIIAKHCSAQSATIVNCASAGITLSIAATMTGTDAAKIAALPDTKAFNNKVVIAGGHLVNYGHPIEQDIRLAGCTPVIAGNEQLCTTDDMAQALDQPGITALLFVESRLITGDMPSLSQAVSLARIKGIPIIVDAAAQDMRMSELVTSGADLLVFSAQKYLAAPTAGIVVGQQKLVEAVHAQGKGIGRSMKAGKEAILGTIAAIEQRSQMDMEDWSKRKHQQAIAFAEILNTLNHITATLEIDPSKGEFWRINMALDEATANLTAIELASQLEQSDPSIHCAQTQAKNGVLNFEILALDQDECDCVSDRIAELLAQANTVR